MLNLFSVGQAEILFQAQLQASAKAMLPALLALAQTVGLAPAVAQQRAEQLVIAIQGALVVSRTLGNNQAFLNVFDSTTSTVIKFYLKNRIFKGTC